MNRNLRLDARWLWLGLLLPFVVQAEENKAPVPSLARLAWLGGHWRLEMAGRVTEEQWMAPAGGVMPGMGRTVAKGRALETEFMQICEGPGGELFYIALPSRQQETAFRLARQTENETVFENREHDFPQVIGYRLNGDGSLLA